MLNKLKFLISPKNDFSGNKLKASSGHFSFLNLSFCEFGLIG